MCEGTFCFHKVDAFSDELEAEVIQVHWEKKEKKN